jgi:putative lipoic acid-binding regulatory protein
MKAASVSTFSWAFIISVWSCGTLTKTTSAFTPSTAIDSRSRKQGYSFQRRTRKTFSNNEQPSLVALAAKKAGTFFNPVPENNDNHNNNNEEEPEAEGDMDTQISDLIKSRNSPSLASEPSTINGVPTSKAGEGFGPTAPKKSTSVATPTFPTVSSGKPFTGIGPPANDVTKPEYDDQGYTVYTNEETGEKARVFEALVDYPCKFTMKIVGANEGLFVEEMVAVVAESCQVEADTIYHTVRCTGKWASVTVKAPVESAKMLYELYENIDKDPRVKFKF